MGTKASSPLVPYSTAARKLGPADLELLQIAYRNICGGGDNNLTRAAFIAHLEEPMGMIGKIAAGKLFDTLDDDSTGLLTFEQFVVGVFIFSRAPQNERLQLLFSMFDSAQTGYLTPKDLADLMLVVTLASKPSTHKEPEPVDVAQRDVEEMQPALDMMVTMAIHRYDSDRDGKLSFDEWLKFAESEPNMAKFERRLMSVITKPLSRDDPDPRGPAR